MSIKNRLSDISRHWVLLAVIILTACSGRPTAERCQKPHTKTTSCTIPAPPLVTQKEMFEQQKPTPIKLLHTRKEYKQQSLKLEKIVAKSTVLKCKDCNVVYTIQVGAFRHKHSQASLLRIKEKSNGATLYSYPISKEISGLSAGQFNSFNAAKSLEKTIRKLIAEDAYIRKLPTSAQMVEL